MKRKALVFGLAAIALLVSSCIIIDGEGNIYGYGSDQFNWRLQGTWETEPESEISQTVRLEISYNTIRIAGEQWGKPLYGFTKNFSLEGYSEESNSSSNSMEGTLKIKNTDNKWYAQSYTYKSPYGSETVLTLIGTGPSPASNLVLYKKY